MERIELHPKKGYILIREHGKKNLKAEVHVQWDPERKIKGNKLTYHFIQVGISRYLIEEFNNEWIVKIEDYTPLVKKILNLTKLG
ncbi:DUF4291 family protein [Chryseobacterium sp. DT-3]|uniref:DUF4291 family protein n=1 Tax=Chryseobacterium sp. DT-3 TaxID=3396164 RepID=UPI003F1CB1B3